jgi:hypothetical protein
MNTEAACRAKLTTVTTADVGASDAHFSTPLRASAHSTGLKTRLRVVRGSGDPAVEHRIGPGDYPVNILGGYRWADAPKLGNISETVLWKEVAPLTDLTAYDLPEAA